MEPIIGGVVLVLLVMGFMPTARGTKAGIEAITDPGKTETPEERDRAHADIQLLLLLLATLAALMFGIKLLGAL